MAKKKEETTWISAKEAAAVLSKNSGREITQAYVRRLGNGGPDMVPQLTTWQVDKRTRLYSKEDVEAYTVKPRGDGSVRRIARAPRGKKQEDSAA